MKMTVGKKIGAGMALALAALVIIGGMAYWNTKQLVEDTREVTQTQLVLEQLDRVLNDATDLESGARGYALTGSDTFLEPYQRASAAMDDAYLSTLRRLIGNDTNQQQRLMILESLIKERLAVAQDVIAARKDKGLDAAIQVVTAGTGRKVMEQIHTVIQDVKEDQNRLLQEHSRASAATSRQAIAVILWGVPLMVVALSLIGWLLTRSISRPLNATAAVAERMARGDLSDEVHGSQRQDEVGALLRAFARMTTFEHGMAELATRISTGDLRVKVTPQSDRDVLGNAFAAMVANLQRLSGEIAEAATVMGAASAEIVATTSQLSTTAAETAAAVAQTTTTVEEVRQTSQLSSEKAQVVSDSAERVAQIAQAGKKSTEEAVEGMKRIRKQMESIGDSMVRLSEQTQAISQIIAAVDDLAAQSNLLAVNAAIEAAKAGEHGKGFAIVAQEVKSLAEQSKQATSRVRTILHDIQRATSAAVMATEQGSRAVEAGVRQSAQAGESILALTNSVTEATQAATQIAASNQQQLVGVDQVARAMENIKETSAQRVISTKQIEASARDLNSIAQKLKDLTERYKV